MNRLFALVCLSGTKLLQFLIDFSEVLISDDSSV